MDSVTIGGQAEEEPEAPEVEVEETANGGVQVTDSGEDSEERPEWLPEKFKNPQEMAKAYSALESKLGAGDDSSDSGQEQEDDPGQSDEDDSGQSETDEGAQEEEGPSPFDAATAEFAENGELSPETYESLEKSGLSKDVVDNYIAGQQALAAQQVSVLSQEVGGEENLQAVLKWADANLSQTEKDAYNRAVDSGDLDAARLQLRGINSRYSETNGREPNLNDSGSPAGGGVKPFASQAQMVRAMRDPRYRKTLRTARKSSGE